MVELLSLIAGRRKRSRSDKAVFSRLFPGYLRALLRREERERRITGIKGSLPEEYGLKKHLKVNSE